MIDEFQQTIAFEKNDDPLRCRGRADIKGSKKKIAENGRARARVSRRGKRGGEDRGVRVLATARRSCAR